MAELPEIPGYRLKKLLGRGGMATVFLAEPAAGGPKVAIKVLQPQNDPGWSQRFLREAEILARLQHPNIVRVLATGQNKGDHYIVMEYLDHGDLTTWIKQGLQPQDALRLLRSLALALDHAHSHGCIHRDVKPDNILFRADGSPVLTDFGVARQRAVDNRLTQIGLAVGTPRYMSPEQHRGSEVDGRTDLYSLGVILHEMLTRQVPYDGPDSMAIGIRHLQDPVPQLPPALARYQRLLDALLAKDPKERPKSGKTVATMIEDLLSQQTTNVKQDQLLAELHRRGIVVKESETRTGFMKKACDIELAVLADDYEALQKHWNAALGTLLEWYRDTGKNARTVRMQMYVHPWILARAQDVANRFLAVEEYKFLEALGVNIRIHDTDGLLQQEIAIEGQKKK